MAMGAHMRLKPGQAMRAAGHRRTSARLAPAPIRGCSTRGRLMTSASMPMVVNRAPIARMAGVASTPKRLPQLPRPQHMGAAVPLSPATAGRRQGRPYIAGACSRVGNRIIVCAALAGVADATSVEALLSQDIKPNDELVVGQLANGLRYVVMPNKTPPQRFEAHLEMHAGSVDELEHEQGVAHLVEHVTFLGSQRRESLLGTGARANAYTDFHHTVFHVHSPLTNAITGAPMLPQVLAALEEIAFKPQFLPLRIEKERKAVLAEAQMMNTVEYRVDCQLLTYLHHENALGCRFPIGKTEQVKTWEHSTLQNFWEKWYFPANATVYVVGDFMDKPTSEIVALIDKSFGHLPAARDKEAAATLARQQQHLTGRSHAIASSANGTDNASSSNGVAGAASASIPPASSSNGVHAGNGTGSSAGAVPVQAEVMEASSSITADEVIAPLKMRHAVRPPVEHKYGHGPLEPGETAVPVNIFRHPLLQHFMLSVFCKLPVRSLNKMGDLRRSFMIRVILSVFQFRVNARYVAANPPFVGVELDISDSGREGTAVSTLTVTAQPKDWEGAVQVAVEEVRRLQRHGVTPGELERYISAMLRDSAQLAEQTNSIPHLDSLDFVMESLALGHTCMSHMEAHEAMVAVAATIDLDSVNSLARSLLTFASDYGREEEMLKAAEADGGVESGLWGDFGPTRATSIVACVPAYMDASGSSIAAGGGTGRPRNAPMGAAGHLDADQLDLAALEKEAKERLDDVEIPEGAMRFDLDGAEIAAALCSPSLEVEPMEDVEVPEHLVPEERVQAMLAKMRPTFVPVTDGASGSGSGASDEDAVTGITRRRLSNGMRINYRRTDNEPKAGLLRVVFNGGRAAEAAGPGPAGSGAVAIGTRALSESGAMGEWRRDQIEVFCITNLINCMLEADEEFIVMDFHFVVGDGGMQSLFELLHEFLRKPMWDEAALERAKQVYRSSVSGVHKSLERATADRIMDAMLGDDRRFRDPKPEEIDALTLEGVRSAVQAQLHPGNLEINVVGDFDAEELESLCLKYLATVPPVPGAGRPYERPVEFKAADMSERHQTWHLRDSDERACAYIAGPAPCRWGEFGNRDPLPEITGEIAPPPPPPPANAPAAVKAAATAARRQHPLYSTVTLLLLTEIMNSRLFTTVRDSLGLTYDVSFEVTMFDRVRTGWFSASVTSYPDKIHEALAASLQVLRDLRTSPVSTRELMRAKRTLITRHESDLKDNNYWLGLLTHLQNETVPMKKVECLRDLLTMYEAATVDDIYDAYSWLNLEDEALFTCVGTSGKAPPPPPDERRLAMYSRKPSYAPDQRVGGQSDTAALFAALMTAAQSKNLAEAFKGVGQGLGKVAHDVLKQDKQGQNPAD